MPSESTPQERGLIIISPDTTNPLDLSNRQEEFQGLILKYLKTVKTADNRGLLRTEENFKKAFQVLLQDILPRGMQLLGITEIKKLEPIYKAGLKDREAMRKEATESLTYTHTYALPETLITASKKQLENFPLVPTIAAVTTLVQMTRARQTILPDFAQQAIDSAKKQFPQATLAMLEEQPHEEQSYKNNMAKLVRNHILAIALKLPTPWVAIEELTSIDNNTIMHALANDQLENIMHGFTLDPQIQPYQESFIQDLLTQTRNALLDAIQRRDAQRLSSIRQRDFMFGVLNKTLFLNPAPIEEERIDLWGEHTSVVIGGARIPSPETLEKMSRYHKATMIKQGGRRSINFETNVYEEGKKAWRLYEQNTNNQNERIVKLTKALAQQTQLLEQITTEQDLPKELQPKALEYMRFTTTGMELDYTYRELQIRIKRAEEAIKAYEVLGTKSLDYLQQLRSQHGGQFPQSTTLPEWITEQYKALRWHMDGARKYYCSRTINRAANRAHADFLNTYDKKFAFPASVDWMTADIATIKEVRDTLEDALIAQQASTDPYVRALDIPIREFEPYIRERIIYYENRLGKKKRPTKGEQDRVVIFQRILAYIEQHKKLGHTTVAAPKTLYEASLMRRVQSIRAIYDNRIRLQTIERYRNPQEWTGQDLAEFEQEIAISTTIPTGKPSLDEATQLTTGGFAYDFWLLRDVHPEHMPQTKEAYETILQTTIAKLDERIEEGRRRNAPSHTLAQKRSALLKLLAAAQTNLFPMPEGKGLSAIRFWNATYQKGMKLRLETELPEMRAKKYIVEQEWKRTLRSTYIRRLQEKIHSSEEELTTLRGNVAQRKFLEQMRSLGLSRNA